MVDHLPFPIECSFIPTPLLHITRTALIHASSVSRYSSDIWSFGLIMLELASGKYPYPSTSSYFELLQAIMEGASPTLPEGDCTDEFGEFVGICLDKEAGHRPAAKDLLKHPWVRMFPLKDDLMLSMSTAFDGMKISGGMS